MSPSRTKRSTPRLSEAATLVIPSGIVTTGWPQVEAKGRELGLGFDWWQCSLGRCTLGKRADGKYAATVGGVVLSIPRQVGKTYFVLALLVIMCILFPGLQVVWTAHRTRTATRTFRSLQGMVKRKKIAPHVLSVRMANGEQEVAFRNGSLIMFGAREQGFGRGFDVIDVEVFDEAQILTEKALEDMVAATNQAKHPHGALLFYMGTPPKPTDSGEVFTIKRKKALGGSSSDMLYLEAAADADANPDDPKQWRKANFSYPQRTPHESMLRLRENLGTDEGWLREGLGIWLEEDTHSALPGWARCVIDAEPPPVVALGIGVALTEQWGSLAAAGFWPDGKPHLGAVDRREGTGWIPGEAKRIQVERNCLVVIDEKCPDKALIRALEDAGVELLVVKLEDYIETCAELRKRVKTRQITHMDTPWLNDAVRDAAWRYVSDRRVIGRKQSAGDVEMLEAAAMALHGAIRSNELAAANNVW